MFFFLLIGVPEVSLDAVEEPSGLTVEPAPVALDFVDLEALLPDLSQEDVPYQPPTSNIYTTYPCDDGYTAADLFAGKPQN